MVNLNWWMKYIIIALVKMYIHGHSFLKSITSKENTILLRFGTNEKNLKLKVIFIAYVALFCSMSSLPLRLTLVL